MFGERKCTEDMREDGDSVRREISCRWDSREGTKRWRKHGTELEERCK